MKVALVIGHGPKKDTGAVNPHSSTTELAFNTRLVNRVHDSLRRHLDCRIIHRAVEGQPPYHEVNDYAAGCAVEFHCNAFNTKASGTEMIHHPGSKKGIRLAQTLQFHVSSALGLPNRGIKPPQRGRGAAFLSRTRCPAVIAESFFIDNDSDLAAAQSLFDELAEAYVNSFLVFATSK